MLKAIYSFIQRLFRKPQITVATYKRKEVDCGMNNAIHKQLRREVYGKETA